MVHGSSKWLVMVAFCWLQSLNGSNSMFGSYSQAIKLQLGYEQQSLGTISLFSTLGACFGVGSSTLLYFKAPSWGVVLVGLVHSSLGYLFLWLTIAEILPNRLWQMCVFSFLNGTAFNYIQTAALVTCVRIFPLNYKGIILGVLKGFYGLSVSILLQLIPLFCNDQACIPLVMSWLPQLLSLIPILLVFMSEKQSKEEIEEEHSGKFATLTGILFMLGVYMFSTLVLKQLVSLSRLSNLVISTFMVLVLISPVLLLLSSHKKTSNFLSSCPLLEDEAHSSPSVSTKEALFSRDFWLLYMLFFIGTGTASAITNNFAQMGNSLGYSSKTINICISLSSISGCFSRIGFGLLFDWFRPVWSPILLAFCMLNLALGTLYGSLGLGGAPYIISILTGLAEGGIWCLALALMVELFGVTSFSTLVNLLATACGLGTYVCSVLLVGSVYDSQVESGQLCNGKSCFGPSFMILCWSAVLAAFISAFLAYRVSTKW